MDWRQVLAVGFCLVLALGNAAIVALGSGSDRALGVVFFVVWCWLAELVAGPPRV